MYYHQQKYQGNQGALKKWHFFSSSPYTFTLPPSKFGRSPPMKFIVLEGSRFEQPTAKKKFTSLFWIKNFMMNFRKRVTKSGKKTCFHGLSWQQRKEYKSNIDENIFYLETHMYPSSKFHFNWSCRSGVRWGWVHSTPPPPFGSRRGSKTPWTDES